MSHLSRNLRVAVCRLPVFTVLRTITGRPPVHVAGSLQDSRFCNSQVGLNGIGFARGRAAGKQRVDEF